MVRRADKDRDKWDHVPWHERLGCSVCKREFYGEKAWNAHWLCRDTKWHEEPGEFFRQVHANGKPKAMFFQYTDGVFVLLEEKAEFITMQERARTAREGRTNGNS